MLTGCMSGKDKDTKYNDVNNIHNLRRRLYNFFSPWLIASHHVWLCLTLAGYVIPSLTTSHSSWLYHTVSVCVILTGYVTPCVVTSHPAVVTHHICLTACVTPCLPGWLCHTLVSSSTSSSVRWPRVSQHREMTLLFCGQVTPEAHNQRGSEA